MVYWKKVTVLYKTIAWKKSTPELKCFKCDFVANTELSLKKHKNTKSEPKSDQLANQEIDAIKTECIFKGIEDIEDMFQLELVKDEQVFACNICNEGFDRHNEVKKHIEEYHRILLLKSEETWMDEINTS